MTKKYAVLTIAIGDYYQKLAKTTHPLIKNYTIKINADFIVWKDSGNWTLPHYRKLDIKDLLNKYERVLYIDTDILVRDDAPNLFDIVPEDSVGMLNEAQFTERSLGMFQSFCAEVGYPLKNWSGRYYNSGVMVISRQHHAMLESPPKEFNHFFEQSYLNLMIHHKNIKMFNLHYKFNRMTAMEGIVGESRFASYFIHYAGGNLAIGEDNLIKQIKADKKQWQKDNGVFKYPKKIMISPSGGLGDVIAAEPAVRYMAEKIYPQDDVIVVSRHPELFSHIKCSGNYSLTDKIKNANEYAKFDSLHTVEHPYFAFVSPLLSHQLTIASHLLMKRTIPLEDRDIKITLSKEERDSAESKFSDIRDYVLVHPGRNWQSKTFPKDVWQSYIDALLDAGHKVAIIGKRVDETQGVVEGLNLTRCIDLVDKTSIKDMLYIMHNSKALISNDSSPIHLAGATDIPIIIIPTTKNHEFILPHRHGSIFYKATAVYKKPLWDVFLSDPLQLYPVLADNVDDSLLRECLPDANNILGTLSRLLLQA